jgi:hypothetical protein
VVEILIVIASWPDPERNCVFFGSLVWFDLLFLPLSLPKTNLRGKRERPSPPPGSCAPWLVQDRMMQSPHRDCTRLTRRFSPRQRTIVPPRTTAAAIHTIRCRHNQIAKRKCRQIALLSPRINRACQKLNAIEKCVWFLTYT